MTRRGCFTPAQRAHVLALPSEPRDLVRFYTFTPSELTWIRMRRGYHNRLGIAVQLALLKHPGQAWSTVLPDAMLRYIAQQIPAAPDTLSRYATRDVTRREHLGELQDRFGWKVFSGQTYRDCIAWLATLARVTDQSLALVKALLDELRRRQILAPSLSVIERLVREGRRQAHQQLFRDPSQDLTASQRSALDALLQPRTDSRLTTMAWLRESDGIASISITASHASHCR